MLIKYAQRCVIALSKIKRMSSAYRFCSSADVSFLCVLMSASPLHPMSTPFRHLLSAPDGSSPCFCFRRVAHRTRIWRGGASSSCHCHCGDCHLSPWMRMRSTRGTIGRHDAVTRPASTRPLTPSVSCARDCRSHVHRSCYRHVITHMLFTTNQSSYLEIPTDTSGMMWFTSDGKHSGWKLE